MRTPTLAIALLLGAAPACAQGPTPPGARWPMHAMDRPRPPIVRPGPARSTPPPEDAVPLFDGRDQSEWRRSADGSAARWIVRDGVLEVNPGSGGIQTARGFGDVQLHLEWSAPTPAGERGQNRGNSGVFLMGRYEVQILDSWDNETYADGQAGALYGQAPPLVNAVRPPGEWNAYDIVFRRPRFDAAGRLLDSARATVFLNGVLIHDHAAFMGATAHMALPAYTAHAERLPLSLQDHGSRVRFRNIWARDLEQPRDRN